MTVTYCRLGPGCDVFAWRGTSIWCVRFGQNLADPKGTPVTTESLDSFAELMAALRRAGFRVPDSVFGKLDREIAARDAAIRDQDARQTSLLALIAGG